MLTTGVNFLLVSNVLMRLKFLVHNFYTFWGSYWFFLTLNFLLLFEKEFL